MKRRALLQAATGLVALPAVAAPTVPRTPYLQRAEVQAFIEEAAAQFALDPAWIARWLRAARYAPRAEQLMQPPPPPAQRNWHEYRARTLDPRRISEGRSFLKSYRTALERATTAYGVPGEYVVAILGVETFYGRLKGTFPTLDVLVTLSFDYTRRADLFRRELGEFLRLCRDQNVDPRVVQGSYAGAIGMPQFLPSSVRRFAVDFDGDGRIDLAASAVDALGSVAAFLAAHGWERDKPVLFAATAAADDPTLLEDVAGGITPNVRWRDLAWRGVQIDGTLDLDTPVLLVDLPVADADGTRGQLLRVATANFCAILHYNRSYLYAASVHALAGELVAGAATTSPAAPSPASAPSSPPPASEPPEPAAPSPAVTPSEPPPAGPGEPTAPPTTSGPTPPPAPAPSVPAPPPAPPSEPVAVPPPAPLPSS